MTLYTWDYVALGMDRRPKPSPNLIARGYQVRSDYTPEPRDRWDKPKPIESYTPTPEGLAWRSRVEATWEARTSDLVWWRVSLGIGVAVIGLRQRGYGVWHPEEAERDLCRLYGEGGSLMPPTDEDTSPGDPRQLPETWRPWLKGQAWIDCSDEDGAVHRSAYMRPFGAPYDPGLSVAECAGREVAYSSGRISPLASGRGIVNVDPETVRMLARLDIP